GRVAVQAGQVYLIVNGGSIKVLSGFGGATKVLDGEDVSAIALTPKFVFFANGRSGVIRRIDRHSLERHRLGTPAEQPGSLAVYAATLYWTEPAAGRIRSQA